MDDIGHKIESAIAIPATETHEIMKPVYLIDDTLLCGKIEYGNNTYLMDLKDRDSIINFNKKFTFANHRDTYPSYPCNFKRITYLTFIHKFNERDLYFENGNVFDLRKCNVSICRHYYHKYVCDNYDVIEYVEGHFQTNGSDAYIIKNPLWKIRENGREYLLMYCGKNTLCKLCRKSHDKILDYEAFNKKKLTWFKLANGYIMCSINLYIHQIITGCYGNGKGTKNISVDHIDRDPLNNSFENLRVATREEQEQNSKGIAAGTLKARSHTKTLPDGLTHDMLKKYVYYNREFYDKAKTKEREFFRVEHPKLGKIWSTSKSNAVSITKKLEQANKVVDDLENNVYPEKDNVLPKYVSLAIMRDKPHLVFERRLNDVRMSIKMVLPMDYDLVEQIAILNGKIKAKYDIELDE